MVRFYSGHMFTYSGFKYNYAMSRYARKRRVVQLRCYHAEREDAGEGEGRGIKREDTRGGRRKGDKKGIFI